MVPPHTYTHTHRKERTHTEKHTHTRAAGSPAEAPPLLRVEKKERARLKTVKFNSKSRVRGVSTSPDHAPFPEL